MTTTAKKKEPTHYLGLRVPLSLHEKLTKMAKRASERAGVEVNVSAVARAILQAGAR